MRENIVSNAVRRLLWFELPSLCHTAWVWSVLVVAVIFVVVAQLFIQTEPLHVLRSKPCIPSWLSVPYFSTDDQVMTFLGHTL